MALDFSINPDTGKVNFAELYSEWDRIINNFNPNAPDANTFNVNLILGNKTIIVTVQNKSLYVKRIHIDATASHPVYDKVIPAAEESHQPGYFLSGMETITGTLSKHDDFGHPYLSTIYVIVSEAARFQVIRRALQNVLIDYKTYTKADWVNFSAIYHEWLNCRNDRAARANPPAQSTMITYDQLTKYAKSLPDGTRLKTEVKNAFNLVGIDTRHLVL